MKKFVVAELISDVSQVDHCYYHYYSDAKIIEASSSYEAIKKYNMINPCDCAVIVCEIDNQHMISIHANDFINIINRNV